MDKITYVRSENDTWIRDRVGDGPERILEVDVSLVVILLMVVMSCDELDLMKEAN